MSLPNLPNGDKLRREVRTEWGGLNLNESAGDGELIEAMNLSSREYPLLASGGPNLRAAGPYTGGTVVSPVFLNGANSYVIRKSSLSYEFHVESRPLSPKALNVTDGTADAIRYAVTRKTLYIFPAKQLLADGVDGLEDMEASQSVEHARFQNGTYQGVDAENNTLYASGANWAQKFRAGDAVTISGSSDSANNKTAVIREISGDELRFYENTFSDGWYCASLPSGGLPAGTYGIGDTGKTFTLSSAWEQGGVLYYRDGDNTVQLKCRTGESTAEGTTVPLDNPPGTPDEILGGIHGLIELFPVTVTRAVPDMDYVCVNENRVWGCKGDTIYASKLGDGRNFNVFDGLSTDSWTTETGTPGDFTGCASFQGYPIFFKGNAVFKVLGDEPRSFTLRKSNIFGVAAGCDRSIVEIRGRLYYVSPVGVVEWTGGDHPEEISHALGTESSELLDAVAGTDGIRYYTELTVRSYDRKKPDEKHLYVYDTRYGTWHEQEHAELGRSWFWWNGVDFRMMRMTDAESGPDWLYTYDLAGPEQYQPYVMVRPRSWTATFADSTRAYKTVLTGSEGKKGVLRLLIRCRVSWYLRVLVAYDGGEFEEAAYIGGSEGAEKDTYAVPLILRRCDRWQLRLTGEGDAVIYSIAVERYPGEWQQA